jgi:hypothetical protein
MKPIYAAYTNEVYANLRPLHATWEPTQPVRLGDIGILNQRVFRQQSSLQTLGIQFTERRGAARPSIWFGSHGTTDLKLTPEIRTLSGLVTQQASLDIMFHCAGATFLHLAGCKSIIIDDKLALRRRVLDLFNNGKWKIPWVVITEVIEAQATTIAIAGHEDASIKLETAASPALIDLAQMSLRFQAKAMDRVDFQLISQSGLTPLFGLSKMSQSWLGEADFGPRLIGEEKSSSEDQWDFTEIT